MSTDIIRDQKVWFDGYDISGVINSLALDLGRDSVDATVLGNDTRVNKAGLKTAALSLQGFYDATPYDEELQGNIGAADKVLTFGATGTEGAAVYFFKPVIGQYSYSGQVGDMFGFSLEAGAAYRMVRGTLMENNSGITSTADGTARQLGAVTAEQKIYAGLHVISAGGTPTLDVTIESDASNSFSGSETTRITFSQMTAIGSQWQEVSGAITDTWWRVAYAVGGTDPDLDFIVSIGIL